MVARSWSSDGCKESPDHYKAVLAAVITAVAPSCSQAHAIYPDRADARPEADDAAAAIDDLVLGDAAEPDPVLDPLPDPGQFDAGQAVAGGGRQAHG